MFEWVGQTVSGAWGGVENIIGSIGKGASSLVSGFFPTPQRTIVESDFTKPRENQGFTYRPVDSDAPSLIETAAYRAKEWLNTPYEDQFAISAKQTESKQLAAQVSTANTTIEPEPFDKALQDVYKFGESVTAKAEQIFTLADQFRTWGEQLGFVERRETIVETPRAGYPEGENLQHLNQLQTAGADVSSIMSTGNAILEQLKGFFNLGYSGPEGAQPVATITHEIQPTDKITKLIIVGVGLFVLFLILRKK